MPADPALNVPPIKLLVGLNNPGSEYARTRHNAGLWALERFAGRHGATLRHESRFEGFCARVNVPGGGDVRLLAPLTFMNASGRAVSAMARFFRIEPEAILVMHDELDLAPGVVRLKVGGGSGGNNGLKDCIKALGTEGFVRARIGIGHPGDRSKVVDYVLSPPTRGEQDQIDAAIARLDDALEEVINGRFVRAMNELNRG